MMCRNNYMKYTTLPYPILTISPTIYQIKSSLHSFSFQQVPYLSFTKLMATMALLAKATKPVFQSHTVWLWNFPKCCSNSALCNWSWDKYCFNYKQKAVVKMKGVVKSSRFLWKLLLFVVKRFYNLLYILYVVFYVF